MIVPVFEAMCGNIGEMADGKTNTYQARMLANWLLNGPYDIDKMGHNSTRGGFDFRLSEHVPEQCLLCKLMAVRASIAERFPTFV